MCKSRLCYCNLHYSDSHGCGWYTRPHLKSLKVNKKRLGKSNNHLEQIAIKNYRRVFKKFWGSDEDQWSIIVEKFSPFNMFNTWNSFKVGLWWLLMVRSICRAPVCRVGGREFTPRTGPTLMITVLKLLKRMWYLCSDICKWLDILVFSDEDEKTVRPFSCISSVLVDGGRWIV